MDKINAALTSDISLHLEKIYGRSGAVDLGQLAGRIVALADKYRGDTPEGCGRLWTEEDVVLITYGDSIIAPGQKPLEVLNRFLTQQLAGTLTSVHLLPFFPYSSDDGFAVSDYLSVNPDLGDWDDVARINESFDLMFDLVVNHISSRHLWFDDFLAGRKPGCDYFMTPPEDADLSEVVRPRQSPLLTTVKTRDGDKKVWTTFSPDQVDVDFSNPDLLVEFLTILLIYLQRGARFIRLDAIAFLWKEWGTNCINLPQTHEVVRLMRTLVTAVKPETVLLTETNVPHLQNVSYFGNSDEAHMVYQFSLAPLLLHALYRGSSEHLTQWARTCSLTPPGCTFFNFTASHDGIGMRPLEGLLPQGEVNLLLKGMESFGGRISYRNREDGSKIAYEINITYFDGLKGTWIGRDSWQLARFLLAQSVMLALRGIPAFYIHSLLATENDNAAVERERRSRLINRHKWSAVELDKLLKTEGSNQQLVLGELTRRIKIRKAQKAFHPDARQEILFLGDSLFGFWRESLDGDQRILAVYNLTDQKRDFFLRDVLGDSDENWRGLLTGEHVVPGQDFIDLPPYHVLWLTPERFVD